MGTNVRIWSKTCLFFSCNLLPVGAGGSTGRTLTAIESLAYICGTCSEICVNVIEATLATM